MPRDDAAAVVFLAGTLGDGFAVIGPYPSWDEAFEAHDGEDGWFMTLHPPPTS
jgi:hypothetical protein